MFSNHKPFRELHSVLKNKFEKPSYFSGLSEEFCQQVSSTVQSSFPIRRELTLDQVLLVSYFLSCAAVLFVLSLFIDIWYMTLPLVFLMVFCLGSEISGFLFKQDFWRYLNNQFQPLSESTFLCEQALKFIDKSESARSYQQKVLQEGRAFRNFDFEILEHLYMEDEKEKSIKNRSLFCKQLHTIEV